MDEKFDKNIFQNRMTRIVRMKKRLYRQFGVILIILVILFKISLNVGNIPAVVCYPF